MVLDIQAKGKGGFNLESKVKDLSLASAGHKKIDWVKEKMTVLNKIKDEYIKEKKGLMQQLLTGKTRVKVEET